MFLAFVKASSIFVNTLFTTGALKVGRVSVTLNSSTVLVIAKSSADGSTELTSNEVSSSVKLYVGKSPNKLSQVRLNPTGAEGGL